MFTPNQTRHEESAFGPHHDLNILQAIGIPTLDANDTEKVFEDVIQGQGDSTLGNVSADIDESIKNGDTSRTPGSDILSEALSLPQPSVPSPKPYLDPTPGTPLPLRQALNKAHDYGDTDVETATALAAPRFEQKEDSDTEIHSIMDQFSDDTLTSAGMGNFIGRDDTSEPKLSEGTEFPPRKSSLEPMRSRDMDYIAQSPVNSISERFPVSPPQVPPKSEKEGYVSGHPSRRTASTTSLPSQLPEPEPEPELPFDFHRFLEQLRHKSADPVAKFLRSFLNEFGKKQWMVHEQVKIINDFLAFITNKMAQCDVWREVSDNEFDNAKEGMEKLVMNRLYSQTFSPAIPPPQQPPRTPKKRRDMERIPGPGRKGQHQEDVERDEILAQKIRIYSWVREDHLDIAPVGPNGERFLRLAQQEILKIKGYRAPRDKVICILNCCKVIFGLLKNASKSDTSADSFVPLLIFVVLQANPENLVSNIQYILRFRNQDKLGGEAGYYLSSLSGAIQFIEGLDRTTLTVSDDDFEKNVEAAVSAIAEEKAMPDLKGQSMKTPENSSMLNSIPSPSMDLTPGSPRRQARVRAGEASDSGEEAAVTGLFRTIQKPLSTIGRIFSDQENNQDLRANGAEPERRLSPSLLQPPRPSLDEPRRNSQSDTVKTPKMQISAQEAAARQASAEAEQARRIQRAEHKTVVDTLCGMFPNLDRDVIDDVVRQKQGRVGLAVDACLSMTASG